MRTGYPLMLIGLALSWAASFVSLKYVTHVEPGLLTSYLIVVWSLSTLGLASIGLTMLDYFLRKSK